MDLYIIWLNLESNAEISHDVLELEVLHCERLSAT